MERTIRIKQLLACPVSEVWRALTDAKILGLWFMENDLNPSVGHEFIFRMAPQKGWDGITHCKVIELEPQHKIAYTYSGSASGEKALACAGVHSAKADKVARGIFTELDTILSFTLTPTCGGTILELKHSGFRGFKLVIVSFVFGMGWKKQLKKLTALLEKAENDHWPQQ